MLGTPVGKLESCEEKLPVFTYPLQLASSNAYPQAFLTAVKATHAPFAFLPFVGTFRIALCRPRHFRFCKLREPAISEHSGEISSAYEEDEERRGLQPQPPPGERQLPRLAGLTHAHQENLKRPRCPHTRLPTGIPRLSSGSSSTSTSLHDDLLRHRWPNAHRPQTKRIEDNGGFEHANQAAAPPRTARVPPHPSHPPRIRSLKTHRERLEGGAGSWIRWRGWARGWQSSLHRSSGGSSSSKELHWEVLMGLQREGGEVYGSCGQREGGGGVRSLFLFIPDAAESQWWICSDGFIDLLDVACGCNVVLRLPRNLSEISNWTIIRSQSATPGPTPEADHPGGDPHFIAEKAASPASQPK
ncbi:hypothetical protein BKA70DRAFT_1225970 [Coprinopsis sp. MPI-PUGE-AT-0042]|nr:hypothetical protein BKA70DRAFT_1225970 [Coprinopsis sp. MPI-PUGE-AT-0042]